MTYSPSVSPVGRANHFSSMGYYIPVTTKRLNNCSNTLCFTYNHNYVYLSLIYKLVYIILI